MATCFPHFRCCAVWPKSTFPLYNLHDFWTRDRGPSYDHKSQKIILIVFVACRFLPGGHFPPRKVEKMDTGALLTIWPRTVFFNGTNRPKVIQVNKINGQDNNEHRRNPQVKLIKLRHRWLEGDQLALGNHISFHYYNPCSFKSRFRDQIRTGDWSPVLPKLKSENICADFMFRGRLEDGGRADSSLVSSCSKYLQLSWPINLLPLHSPGHTLDEKKCIST